MITFTSIALIACILNIFLTISLESPVVGAIGWMCAAILTLSDLLNHIGEGL